jgi:1,4-alpha-glucan branching enzyme
MLRKHSLLVISVCTFTACERTIPVANVVPDDWNREELPMKKDPYGVWEITVPAKDGQPAIPHNSKVKVR